MIDPTSAAIKKQKSLGTSLSPNTIYASNRVNIGCINAEIDTVTDENSVNNEYITNMLIVPCTILNIKLGTCY